MAQLTGPLHSETARGTIGGALTFSMHGIYPKVRYQKKQKYTPTASQLAVRAVYASAVAGWNGLDVISKGYYSARADTLMMSGYNLYVQEFLFSYYGCALYGLNEYGADGT